MPNSISGADRLGRCCWLSLVCLLAIVLWSQGALSEPYLTDRAWVDLTPGVQYRPQRAYSLLRTECESEWASAGGPATPGQPLTFMCGYDQVAANPGSDPAGPVQDAPFPALEWKSIQETIRLRPTAGASIGIEWFGTFDGDVSVVNVPIVGTNLVSMSSGVLNFGSAIGVGLGGVYAQFGFELPLYFKYPNFWSLSFTFGTIYNLGFFLNNNWESTGIWGGGPKFILELGVLRITTTLALGYAGRYCRSFLCDGGVGTAIILNVALIGETTGLPRQR